MRKLYLLNFLPLLFTTSVSFTQANLNAVYAGIELRQTINGTQTIYWSYYFRPDGTYNYELNKPNWKNGVNGTYTLRGKQLLLVSAKNGLTNKMEIINEDMIRDNATSLFKYEVMNQIPAQTFSQLWDDGQIEISFDGKGHFVQSGYRGTSTLNKNNDFDGKGTYTITASELVLHFDNGKVETKSFFYSGGKNATALINGSTYNAIKEKQSNSTVQPRQETNTTGKPNKQKETTGSSTDDKMTILQKANLAHGGKALDSLKTIKLSATIDKITVTQLLDINEQKIRMELYRNNKVFSVEQVEKNSGWLWRNGKVIALTPERVKEMQATFITGILGLRSENLKNLQVLNTKTSDVFKTITITTEGETYRWIFDKDYHLSAEINDEKKRSSTLKDFRLANNIVLPFTTVETSNTQSFTVSYSSVIINPRFLEKEWSKPE